jgi:hypothetical protein
MKGFLPTKTNQIPKYFKIKRWKNCPNVAVTSRLPRYRIESVGAALISYHHQMMYKIYYIYTPLEFWYKE